MAAKGCVARRVRVGSRKRTGLRRSVFPGAGRTASVAADPDRSPFMKFFADTAVIADIRELAEAGLLDGVTTTEEILRVTMSD